MYLPLWNLYRSLLSLARDRRSVCSRPFYVRRHFGVIFQNGLFPQFLWKLYGNFLLTLEFSHRCLDSCSKCRIWILTGWLASSFPFFTNYSPTYSANQSTPTWWLRFEAEPEILQFHITIWHVNSIPTMQFFTGTSRNTQWKSYMLSLTLCVCGISKIKHCGIFITMPYWSVEISAWINVCIITVSIAVSSISAIFYSLT